MAFHRHFVERTDFELFVATTDKRVLEYDHPYSLLLFEQQAWVDRLCRTRFGVWAHSFKHLFGGNLISTQVLRAAQAFRPDLIFTIAGSWDWTARMSQHLARALRVPLVGSFNDWFDFGIIIHPQLRMHLEKQFRAFYRACDLAWCTCDGMRMELGAHPNAQILYPLGAEALRTDNERLKNRNGPSRFIVAFAGNLSDWYGTMLERLVTTAIAKRATIEFRLFGKNPSWTFEFDRMVQERAVFRGYLPFDQLREEMAEVDALLLPMGFDAQCALVERTSFKTKFLDYLAYGKPILVWGPEYCSAVRVAREFDSAEICTDPDASAFLRTILDVQKSRERQHELVANARKMYEARFNPDKIHSEFVQKMRQIVEGSSTLLTRQPKSHAPRTSAIPLR